MRDDYDMLGNQIHSASMEAGERWMLNDVMGKPIHTWNSRGYHFTIEYDPLRRPLRSFVEGGDGDTPLEQILFQRIVYGEQHLEGTERNLRGRVFMHFDQAGFVGNNRFDFKGNALSTSRWLAREYKESVNRPAIEGALPADVLGTIEFPVLSKTLSTLLEGQAFTTTSTYDALNRPLTLTTPDNSVVHPAYNEANLLERVEANLRGSNTATEFIRDIDYNAKGQRESIVYGNGVRTDYEYDPLTFRLTRLQTLCGADPLQDLSYVYDPAGNITSIRDDAQQIIYFNNTVVEPHADYTYDAIYRLIAATGREHIGQLGQPRTSWNDAGRTRLPHPHDGQAMRRYTESYDYDEVGNFLHLIHQAANGGSWTREYAYEEASLIEPGKQGNRLSRTIVSPNGAQPLNENYTHDIHGNMTSMPHLLLVIHDVQGLTFQCNGGAVHLVLAIHLEAADVVAFAASCWCLPRLSRSLGDLAHPLTRRIVHVIGCLRGALVHHLPRASSQLVPEIPVHQGRYVGEGLAANVGDVILAAEQTYVDVATKGLSQTAVESAQAAIEGVKQDVVNVGEGYVRHIHLLREAVRGVRQRYPFHIDAWVVLPDHLHCIWTFPAGDADYLSAKPKYERNTKADLGVSR